MALEREEGVTRSGTDNSEATTFSSRRWMVEKRHAINDAALREQLHI